MEQFPTTTIHTHFANLDDPRMERTKAHQLLDMITIALCGAMGGADTWVNSEEFGNAKYEWLRTFLGLPNRIPAHDTLHMVSAWAAHNRLVLGHRNVDATSHAMTAIPARLRVLDLQGCTVTIDAMGCQTAIAEQIVAPGADYVLALKDNQEQVPLDVQATFRYAQEAGFRGIGHACYRTVEGAHGRRATRQDWIIAEPEYLA